MGIPRPSYLHVGAQIIEAHHGRDRYLETT